MVALLPLMGPFAMKAGMGIAKRAFGLDALNRKNESLRNIDQLKYQQKRDDYYAKFGQAFQNTHFANQAIVAGHNRRVEEYGMRIAQLDKEEAMAYEDVQRQSNGVVSGFMEDNLDLLKEYVTSSGSLAASGINSASAMLSTMKNMDNGFLESRSRLQGNAAGQMGQIVKTIEKMEHVSNSQRNAWYHAVKDKPALRPYPQMKQITPYKTPSHLKARGLSFNDVVPDLVDSGISVFGGAVAKGLAKDLAGYQ